MRWLRSALLWSVMAAVIASSRAWPNADLDPRSSGAFRADCAGNLMRLSWDEALAAGNELQVEAFNGSRLVFLTPTLAAQCGYSMESDPWGDVRIYASLMACFVDNQDDTTFDVGLRLKLYSRSSPDVVSRDVRKTCSYSRWASTEILCDRNYMEVGGVCPGCRFSASVGEKIQLDALFQVSKFTSGIWKVTFDTPEPVSMVLKEAEQAGYSVVSTSRRLVMRSPYNTAETRSENVAGIPMEVFKVILYHTTPHGMSLVKMAAACPVGGVLFTEDVVSWHVPRRVTPLIDDSFRIAEMHMGINGKRLDRSQMAKRGYTLATTDFHIVLEMPVGSPDGYYKSHAPDYQYHITYTLEPMLEVLWRKETGHDDLRFKVLFPITTPLMPRPPRIKDDTAADDRLFRVHVGTFLQDVALRNITFSTGVLTVAESIAKGFAVREHIFLNGSKSFSLQVRFEADVVSKHNLEPLVTIYNLSLIFGFVALPEETPFAHPVEIQASSQDVVLPTISGTCDQNRFYVSVDSGNQGGNFHTMVGPRRLTPEVSKEYGLLQNGTNFSLVVPYDAPGTVFEFITTDSVRARLDLLLFNPKNDWVLADFYLACFFPLITTSCYPNGTMTAIAVKLESVPNLIPSWLTLRDKSCRPALSDDRFAQFSFSVDSCGTTRTFFDHYMLYENEISLHYNHEGLFRHDNGAAHTSPKDPDYRQTVSCIYVVNETGAVSFNYQPRVSEPAAEIGSGRLMVRMRLAKDSSYELFYEPEDYPVATYLRQPLYFEVALVASADPQLELALENCWATLHEERTSLPRWDLIVDNCENREDKALTVFHPVEGDSSALIKSHVKRFSIKTFAFTRDEEVLEDEIHVHCDAVICDEGNQADGVCRGRCVGAAGGGAARQETKGGVLREQRVDPTLQRQMSFGPLHLNN
ncbi:uncharacterized protein [Brachionichthys hirsutus]|uniref:uncharacterized protein n=1 Tax=Brachionichthys hirsutus TaxID=412623 RepID=UPI003604D746